MKQDVEALRKQNVNITDNEVSWVVELCKRKMEVAKVQNPEEYLPILFADEIKNYVFRRAINAITTLRMMGEEVPCSV